MKSTNQSYKRLWRSRENKRIAGVCGGIGEYFAIDPILIRILFIVLFLAGGAAFIVYIIMWILVPLEPRTKDKKAKAIEHDS